MRRYRLTNEPELHERYQQHGYQQGDAQNQRNGPGETQQEVVYHAGNHNQEGEECDTDGQCSRENGLKKCVALKIDACQRDIPSPIFSK